MDDDPQQWKQDQVYLLCLLRGRCAFPLPKLQGLPCSLSSWVQEGYLGQLSLQCLDQQKLQREEDARSNRRCKKIRKEDWFEDQDASSSEPNGSGISVEKPCTQSSLWMHSRYVVLAWNDQIQPGKWNRILELQDDEDHPRFRYKEVCLSWDHQVGKPNKGKRTIC